MIKIKKICGVKTIVITSFSILLLSLCLFLYFKNHAGEQILLREKLEEYGTVKAGYSSWYEKLPAFLKEYVSPDLNVLIDKKSKDPMEAAQLISRIDNIKKLEFEVDFYSERKKVVDEKSFFRFISKQGDIESLKIICDSIDSENIALLKDTGLTELILETQDFQGDLLNEICSLTSLQNLYITTVEKLQAGSFKNLSRLENLEILGLNRTGLLDELEMSSDFTSIPHFNSSNLYSASILTYLPVLKNLKKLYLVFTRKEELKLLKEKCPKIEIISAYNQYFTDGFIEGLSQIETLKGTAQYYYPEGIEMENNSDLILQSFETEKCFNSLYKMKWVKNLVIVNPFLDLNQLDFSRLPWLESVTFGPNVNFVKYISALKNFTGKRYCIQNYFDKEFKKYLRSENIKIVNIGHILGGPTFQAIITKETIGNEFTTYECSKNTHLLNDLKEDTLFGSCLTLIFRNKPVAKVRAFKELKSLVIEISINADLKEILDISGYENLEYLYIKSIPGTQINLSGIETLPNLKKMTLTGGSFKSDRPSADRIAIEVSDSLALLDDNLVQSILPEWLNYLDSVNMKLPEKRLEHLSEAKQKYTTLDLSRSDYREEELKSLESFKIGNLALPQHDGITSGVLDYIKDCQLFVICITGTSITMEEARKKLGRDVLVFKNYIKWFYY